MMKNAFGTPDPRVGTLPSATGFVPALESFRALAAFAVLTTHVAFQTGSNTGSLINRIWGRFDLSVALFFALITVERTALYGILKAVGASGSTLFVGVVSQFVPVIGTYLAGALPVLVWMAYPDGEIFFFNKALLEFSGFVGDWHDHEALLTAIHPDDLGALVLIGATADPAGPLTGFYRGFARALPYVNPERMAAAMNVVFRRLGATGEHADLLPDGAGYAALPAAWQLVIDECGPDLLREVGCPVWMVNGQLDQMRIHVGRFAEAAVDARVVTVPRATHLMPATHPEQVAAVLRAAVAQAR